MARNGKHEGKSRLSTADNNPTVRLEEQLRAHAAELYPLLSNPAVNEFHDEPMPQSCAALAERFKMLEARQSPDGTEQWLNWVIRLANGDAAGFVQATVHQDRTADFAYSLGHKYWGKGLAFAAVSQMLSVLAEEYSVKKLRASVDPRNIRSIHLLNRLGMHVDHIAASGDLICIGDTRRILDAL